MVIPITVGNVAGIGAIHQRGRVFENPPRGSHQSILEGRWKPMDLTFEEIVERLKELKRGQIGSFSLAKEVDEPDREGFIRNLSNKAECIILVHRFDGQNLIVTLL